MGWPRADELLPLLLPLLLLTVRGDEDDIGVGGGIVAAGPGGRDPGGRVGSQGRHLLAHAAAEVGAGAGGARHAQVVAEGGTEQGRRGQRQWPLQHPESVIS